MSTFYVTKYALTEGVEMVEGIENQAHDVIKVKAKHIPGHVDRLFFCEGREWHRTPEAAIARAEKMRDAKIASVERQLVKLRKMTFSVE